MDDTFTGGPQHAFGLFSSSFAAAVRSDRAGASIAASAINSDLNCSSNCDQKNKKGPAVEESISGVSAKAKICCSGEVASSVCWPKLRVECEKQASISDGSLCEGWSNWKDLVRLV